MIAVIFYELDFDVEHDSDSAHIYADVGIEAVYVFDTKELARDELSELKAMHPGKQYVGREVKCPAAERAERDKYQMRMEEDWS